MEKGLVHIYCGDGKGKTTAAAGLALRCAGAGGSVLFAQFLKDGSSGEIRAFEKIENITVLPPPENVKFSFKMTRDEKEAARLYYTSRFKDLEQAAGSFDMIVMDELLHAVNLGFVPQDDVAAFLNGGHGESEIVITGRDPSDALCAAADYITEMKKIKHPFDRGIKARKKVEF